MTDPLLSPDQIDALRTALRNAEFTPTGVADYLGETASGALGRGEFLAVRHTIRDRGDDDPRGTLIDLFPTGGIVSEKAADTAFGAFGLARAISTGLVEKVGDGIRAAIDLSPYGDDDGDWWVLSDLGSDVRPGPVRSDHVLGIGGASLTLAQSTVRPRVRSALDLGTGCGVQALHLSRHVDGVTVTDLSERSVRFAVTNAALNGFSWEALQGDLAAPVAGRRFDLVVSNPPFVVGPRRGEAERMVYRDSGREGDGICAELVAALPGLLNPGGYGQLLANWLHVEGEPWEERVGGWLAATGLDAHAVQREALDPAGYVALWLRDAGELTGAEAARRTGEWLDWFTENRIDAVGFGLISVHAAGSDQPVVRVEEAMQEHDAVLGPEVASWFERVAFVRGADLLRERFVAAPGLRLRQIASHSEDGWEVDQQILALETGWRWSQEVDPVAVALVGGCDGTVTLGDQITVLAAAYEAEPIAFATVAIPLVGRMVERGLLLPAS
ncbi:DUF7059 domain-containing protein [Cryptosporangium phraense]|uniref:Methyltransferase n=1 Tax=Cryptosporangium phraense TaxID=2593070 RepID=A0A545AKM1_9ACTN|nr:methyltransferase [Cryptosporangium phraense]TQS41295.1 methyltransferase [Cryptosporangium phraense]